MDDINLATIRAEFERRNRIADQLVSENPGLPHITAIIMAGDIESAERAWEQMQQGQVTYKEALVRVGSYARLRFADNALRAGYATEDEVLSELPDLWAFSDPNDTDPYFLDLWRRAWARNDRRYIRDGRPLPRASTITVYRGQDEGAKYGISWTTDRAIAERFANGAALRVKNRGGVVYFGTVDRRNIMAYLTGRGESEVIVEPRHVKIGGWDVGQSK